MLKSYDLVLFSSLLSMHACPLVGHACLAMCMCGMGSIMTWQLAEQCMLLCCDCLPGGERAWHVHNRAGRVHSVAWHVVGMRQSGLADSFCPRLRAQIVRELKAMAQALRPPRNRKPATAGASVSSTELDARGIPSGRPPAQGGQRPGTPGPAAAAAPPAAAAPAAAASPAAAGGGDAATPAMTPAPSMARAGTLRAPIVLGTPDEQQLIIAASRHPGLPRSKVSGSSKDSKEASKEAAAAPEEGAAAPAAAAVAEGGPGTPPERQPGTENISREHSEESQAAAEVSTRLGGLALKGGGDGSSTAAAAEPAAVLPAAAPEQQRQQPAGAEEGAAAAAGQAPDAAAKPPAALQAPPQSAFVNPFSSAFAYTERMNSAFSSN